MVVALIWTAELLDEYVADNIVSSKLTAKRERALVERRIVHGRYVRDHLTSSTPTSPFCHSCLANQTLIMNMLANYLPDDDVR
jgi:hypothetical protein